VHFTHLSSLQASLLSFEDVGWVNVIKPLNHKTIDVYFSKLKAKQVLTENGPLYS